MNRFILTAAAILAASPAMADDWVATFPTQTTANNAAKFVGKWWDTLRNRWMDAGGVRTDPNDPPWAIAKIPAWYGPPCTNGTDADGNPIQTCTPKTGVFYLIRVLADVNSMKRILPNTATVTSATDPQTGIVTTTITLTNGSTFVSPPPADTPIGFM